MFNDSSWQDCPDTSRSTGCYLVYFRIAKVVLPMMPPLYLTLLLFPLLKLNIRLLLLASLAANTLDNYFKELHGLDPDTPLTIPILTNS